jgi:TPR repeat protein
MTASSLERLRMSTRDGRTGMTRIATLISSAPILVSCVLGSFVLTLGTICANAAEAIIIDEQTIAGYGGGAPPRALRKIEPLARRGNARAEALLGFMYEHGLGVPQSWPAAVDHYLVAAEKGDPGGQYLLGLMYDKGFGTSRDLVLAYKWLDLAAGHAPRQSREHLLRLRDAVASKMTKAQIDLGEQLALEWSLRAGRRMPAPKQY